MNGLNFIENVVKQGGIKLWKFLMTLCYYLINLKEKEAILIAKTKSQYCNNDDSNSRKLDLS